MYRLGVKQGCILSPLLFSLFLNDVVRHLESEKMGISINEAMRIFILLYADDIVLLAENQQDLEELLTKLAGYVELNQMTVNIKKTKFMIFETKGCKQTDEAQIFFKDQQIERVFSYKYLGLIFDSKLSFKEHIQYALMKARKGAFMFWKYTRRFPGLKKSQLLNLFFVLVVPILLYGSEVWGPTISALELSRLEQFYLKNLRMILNVSSSTAKSAVFLELGVLPIKALVEQNTFKFVARLPRNLEDLQCFQRLLQTNSSWINSWRQITQKLEINEYPFCDEGIVLEVECARLIIQQHFEAQMLEDISNMSSLKLLSQLKGFLEFETYIDIPMSPWKKKYLAQFRCGDHPLLNRHGAMLKIPVEQRKCRFCDSDSIEDEEHIFLHCNNKAFQEIRKNFFSKAKRICSCVGDNRFDFIRQLRIIWKERELILLFAEFLFKIFNIVRGHNVQKKEWKIVLI